jgi:protease I
MKMGRICVLISNFFEDAEYTKPAEALKEAGHELVHVGLRKGEIVRGKKEGTEVKIDKSIGEVSIGDFDAVLIPGGYSPDQLRAHEEVVNFVRDFVRNDKPLFAICHGPQLLITADVIRGRKVTGYKSIVQDIKNAGADFVDQEVVIDGNLVTSRTPGDLPAFVRESLKKLEK